MRRFGAPGPAVRRCALAITAAVVAAFAALPAGGAASSTGADAPARTTAADGPAPTSAGARSHAPASERAQVTRAPRAASRRTLVRQLRRAMGSAGGSSGAYVVDAETGRPLLRWRHTTPRILASNAKLFTTAATLARFGPDGSLETAVRGDGRLGGRGVWRGDLFLVGGGDPTFGSRSFAERAYGVRRPTVQTLAAKLDRAGIEHVTGRIYGDESAFDSLRGGPDSGYGTSIWVGPLSALGYNRGLAAETGASFQGNPPAFAAARLTDALRARGVSVRRRPSAGVAPRSAQELAAVRSPSIARLAAMTNKPSDNYFAEMLLKALAMRAHGQGTTAAGAKIAARFARRLGGRPARLADGSGLSRANRASPYRVVRLLAAMRERDELVPFARSLAVAGRDGTLDDRMRRGPARGRCRGKTGTLSNVSALSGWCRARSGDTYLFSILMNRVDPYGARALQDRMLQAIAGSR
ncbi:MAG: D-alanyl-D-alanine carboxypeptidase/D-alanyl-D-alanine-endopeptidase [Thermoleophilaceae bacterium]